MEKLQIVLSEMYEITKEMYLCVSPEYFLKEKFICYGKLYNSINEIETEKKMHLTEEGPKERIVSKNPNIESFRDKYVDEDIILYITGYIKDRMKLFIKENQDGDLQTLFLGCVLNLYYSSGLFERAGILDINIITDSLADEKTKEYVLMMEIIYLKQLTKCYKYIIENVFSSTQNEILDSIAQKIESYLYEFSYTQNEEMLKKIEEYIIPEYKYTIDFIAEILRNIDRFNYVNSIKEDDCNIEKLKAICSEYQYAHILLCMKSVEEFLVTKGENVKFMEYISILDEDIFNIAIGISQPSSLQAGWIDEGNKILCPETISKFGLGFPYVEFMSKQEYCQQINSIRLNEDSSLFYPFKLRYTKENMIKTSLKLAHRLNMARTSELKAKNDKKKIIKQFSHTYMNMRATSLYNIATELLKCEDIQYRNYGRKLLYEYTVKQNLTKDVEMLKLRFEDNVDDLYEIVTNSILSENEDGVKIGDLIDDSIIRCMVTLVHDGSNSAKRLREKFKNYDWIFIRNSFENEILLRDNQNVKEWFCKNMFKLSIEISEKWNNVVFEKESYAALLFTDIISELIINIFKYADKTQNIEFKFGFIDDKYLTVETQNYIDDVREKVMENGYGLQSEAEILRILNELKEEPLTIKTDKNVFEVQFKINIKLFSKESGE